MAIATVPKSLTRSKINTCEGLALKRKAKRVVEELSKEKIRIAVDFLDYLKEKEEMEATFEILSNRELMAQIEEAEKAINKKNLNEFISWEKIKRDV